MLYEVITELRARPESAGHALAQVFKVEIDPYVGRLAVFRVHQGRIASGSQLYVGEGKKPIKATHLYRLCGKTQTEVSEALPGDICAIAKVDEILFDHVLHDSAEDAHIHARPLELPSAVFGLAMHAKKRGDEQKISDVLHRLIAEDPCLKIEHNVQANETVMRVITSYSIHYTKLYDIFLLLTGFFTFTAGAFFERGEASLASFFSYNFV